MVVRSKGPGLRSALAARGTGVGACASALAGIAVLLAPSICRADDAQELELGKNRFDAGQYEEAHAKFAVLQDPTLPTCDHGQSGRCRITDPDLIERARALDAAALIALKRLPEADAQITKILRENPLYVPSPALFPQEVVDRFTEVRGRLREQLTKEAADRAARALKDRLAEQKRKDAEEKWIADLQKLAGTERVVEKHSRLIAALPFGIGQFQNGDKGLGILFAVTEGLFGATSLTAAAVVSGFAGLDLTHCNGACRAKVQESADLAVLVNQISFSVWAAAATIGIIQAQVAFVPEKVTFKPRPIPPRPEIKGSISLMPGGFGIGIVGKF